jgi:hypothetical protein
MPRSQVKQIREPSIREILLAQDERLDKIETRINYLFGGLAVLITLANLVAPIVIRDIFK